MTHIHRPGWRAQLRTWLGFLGQFLAWAFVWGVLGAIVLGVSAYLDTQGTVGGRHSSGTGFRCIGMTLVIAGSAGHGIHVARLTMRRIRRGTQRATRRGAQQP